MVKRIWLLTLIICICLSAAVAEEYSARLAEDWLLNLADYLAGFETINDPTETGDLSRPGEYLLQYDFGTVVLRGETIPKRGAIVEVTMETPKIADCLGHAVGMNISDLGIPGLNNPVYPLTLASMQQEGIGWLWIYSTDGIPYGIEWVSYDLESAETTETVLTYSVRDGVITAIHARRSEMSESEALANLASVAELDATQRASARAEKNDLPALSLDDAVINGTALMRKSIDHLAQVIGDPDSSQNLPAGQGRLLLYDGLIAACNLEEQTGVETLRGFTVVSDIYTGPRNIRIGMALRETAALFRADRTVTSAGGTLYEERTASGLFEGQLVRFEENEETLVYRCESGEDALWLEMTFQNEQMTAWRLYLTDVDRTGISETAVPDVSENEGTELLPAGVPAEGTEETEGIG